TPHESRPSHAVSANVPVRARTDRRGYGDTRSRTRRRTHTLTLTTSPLQPGPDAVTRTQRYTSRSAVICSEPRSNGAPLDTLGPWPLTPWPVFDIQRRELFRAPIDKRRVVQV